MYPLSCSQNENLARLFDRIKKAHRPELLPGYTSTTRYLKNEPLIYASDEWKG